MYNVITRTYVRVEGGVAILIGDVIKEIRVKMGLTQGEFAAMLGVGQTALSNWERGKREPDLETLNVISRISGVSLNKIADAKSKSSSFSYADYYLDALDSNGEQYYAVKMTGDSMDKLRIYDGDTLIIKSQDRVQNKDIALVCVNDSTPLVREYYIDGSTVTLTPHSTNRNHKMKFYNLRTNKVRILGKVISNIIKF